MDLSLTSDEIGFRDEVRAFLAAHVTPEKRRAQALTPGVYPEPDLSMPWQKLLHARGWGAPNWPAEYGGTGWSLMQRYIFETECALAGAPFQHPQGLRMVGPVIMRFGSDEQKSFYLPRIVSGEDYWCQGYSEPGAGSDLAALSMRAVCDGDHYILNGSKIWTTHAHHANRMFALVRTDASGRKQDGISFILIDMESPGITIRPILTIGGDHEVNQVFFDTVRVPAANLVGKEGAGWSYGKYLLEFERGGAITSGRLKAALNDVEALAARTPDGEGFVIDDPDIAIALAAVRIDVESLEMTELRVMSALQLGQNPGPASSLLKLRSSQLRQSISELALKVLGTDAIRWQPRRPLYEISNQPQEHEVAWLHVAKYLDARAYTIFGGTAEVQKEILAKEIIGS